MTGRSIARKTRSGMFVGPGICRKGRPLITRTTITVGYSLDGALRRRPQVLACSPGGYFGTGLDAELGENVLEVRLDGALGDQKLIGGLSVGEAAGHERGDLPFTTRQE